MTCSDDFPSGTGGLRNLQYREDLIDDYLAATGLPPATSPLQGQ
jgi:hypothetical protein